MKKKIAIVTGAAGFVGANLIEILSSSMDWTDIIGIDNFSTGKAGNLQKSFTPKFTLVNYNISRDTLGFTSLKNFVKSVLPLPDEKEEYETYVFHLAANADVRHGFSNIHADIDKNIITTQAVLEMMKDTDIRNIVFASSCSVYGNTNQFPTPEDAKMPQQTSMYGMSKLACEGMIEAYSYKYGFKALIPRFCSMLGRYYSHGHVKDFHKQYKRDGCISVLGDGNLRKNYIHVEDAMNIVLKILDSQSKEQVQIVNVCDNETHSVKDTIKVMENYYEKTIPVTYDESKKQGWVGDEKIDASNAKMLKYRPPTFNFEGAVEHTLDWLEVQTNEYSAK